MSKAPAECDALARLRAHMAEQLLPLCIVSHPIHVGYLAGFVAPADRFAAVIVTPESATLVAPASMGLAPCACLEMVPYEDYALTHPVDLAANGAQALQVALEGIRGRPARIGLEPAYLPATVWDLVRRVTGSADALDINPALRRLRAVKSDSEVQAIRRAVATCDRIFEAVESDIRAGASELDVYLAALRVVATDSGGPAVLDGDFVSGSRTEAIGGPPTPRTLREGDLLIVDVYPRLGAYWADCTRTFAVGEPAPELLERHSVLVEAMEAGQRAIEPGRPAGDVYRAVKSVLDRAGLGDRFPHHAGHAVGLTPAEEPRLIPGNDARLEVAMTLTLEPGVYAPGQGGMRLEDDFLVTPDGCQCLSQHPRRLVVLG